MGRAGPQSQGMGAGAGKWVGGMANPVGACLLGFERHEEPLYFLVFTHVYTYPQNVCVLTLRKNGKDLCMRPSPSGWRNSVQGVCGPMLPSVPTYAL